MVDRPRLDAVAVLAFRRGVEGLEFLTRQNLRPAAHFRHEKVPNVPDGRSHLFCEEIVAGLLEENEKGEPGLRARAAAELLEEAGFTVAPAAIELLGPPFFVAPGIISEKIFLAAVDVTGLASAVPEGDGTPMEEGGALQFRTLASIEAALADGTIQDAKTELGLRRFLFRESLRSGASSSSTASSSVVISSSTSVSV